jgi:inorganic triphosphatase YgiF
MFETELKITLDAAGEARLRRHPALAGLRAAPRRTQRLVSTYFDTGGHALAAAGISLRLRRAGRRWVQTVKRREGAVAAGGFFSHLEIERPAPGGRLALAGPDPQGVYAAIAEAAAGEPLAPVFETRVRRTVERLAPPGGGLVELAVDVGEILAGAARAPIREAELELVEGEVGAVYELARLLFPDGPVRFAELHKAARGYRLARGEPAEPPAAARRAGTPAYDAGATVETVARDVMRDCLGQIAANMAVVADGTDIEGPHQLRVGLRRLRTAFAIFGPSLGDAALTPLSAEARRLGQAVGTLRDSDVLIEEVVAGTAALGLDAAAGAALTGALAARREGVREEVRTVLAAPDAVGFLFDLGRLIEGRGWLEPGDWSQSTRLAAPIGEVAPAILDKRHAKAMKRGRRIETLDAEELHALRKELKKLRYAVDALGLIFPGRKVGPYLEALKELQDSFGSLNDAAMAAAALAGPEAPGARDPAAQRGAGWVLGALAVRAGADRPRLIKRWRKLAKARPFWS